MGGKAFRGEIKAGRTEKWLLSSRHSNLSIRAAGISQSDSWWSRRWGKGGEERVLRSWRDRRNLEQGLEVDMGSSGPCGFLLITGSLLGMEISLRCLCSPWCPTNCSKKHLNLESLLRNIYTLHRPDSVTFSYSRGWVCPAPCSSLRAQRRWDPC